MKNKNISAALLAVFFISVSAVAVKTGNYDSDAVNASAEVSITDESLPLAAISSDASTLGTLNLAKNESAIETAETDAEAVKTETIVVAEAESYSGYVVCNASDYANVRSAATTDSDAVGRMYNGAVGEILSYTNADDGLWFEISSGDVTGYVRSDFLTYGDDAQAVVDAANANGTALTYAKSKEVVDAELAEEQAAKEAEEEAEKEAASAAQASEETASATSETAETATASVSTNSDLRSQVVNYALSFVGIPYVHGGNSLSSGTDCSGFTSLIFANFGISLSRTPSGQYSSNGRSISLDQIQPGDIVCYTSASDGHCTHVGIYVGNGMIVHESNPTKGCVTQSVGYDTIIAVKNVID